MSLLNWALRSQIYTKNIWIELGKKQRDNTLSWQACFVIRSFFGSYFYILSTVIRKNGNIDFFIKIKNKKICIYIYIYIYLHKYLYHQLKELLTDKEIFLVSTIRNLWWTVWRICTLLLCKGFKDQEISGILLSSANL